MKVLIVSDNHQDDEILKKVVRINKDIDLYLHAGDSEQSEEELLPFLSVRGNNDYLIKQDFKIIDVKWAKIYLTHGHKEFTQYLLLTRAKKYHCNFIIHGHTHKGSITIVNDIPIICPGALSFPRGGQPKRYAILTIFDEYGKYNLDFKDILD